MDINNLYKRINLKQGVGCEISEFCSLENVVLGDNVIIRDAVQLKNVVIGDNTKVGTNVRLYSPDVARPVRIGRQCWFSYGVFGEATGGDIVVADGVTVAHRAIFLTSSGPGKNNTPMSVIYPDQLGPIQVGPYVWIGAQCTLLPGSRLAEGVVLGAHALAGGGDYEAWTVYGGAPAKIIKKLDPEKVAQAKEAVK